MADNIRDKEIVLTPPLRVPLQFSLPPSLDVELFKERDLAEGESVDNLSGNVVPGGGDDNLIDERNDSYKLPPPANVRVVSQTIRYGTGGNQVVDLVLEADPVDGATGYDIRRADV